MPAATPYGGSDRPGSTRTRGSRPVRAWTTPAHTAAPRRTRVGLAAQFVLQFLYVPLGFLLVICLVALLVWMVSSGGGGGGSSTEVGAPATMLVGLSRAGISWRRLRVEWNGRPEDWEPFTEGLLKDRFARAERKSGWGPAELPPSGVRRAVTGLGRHHYRGLAPTRVEELAERHGWSVDWARSRSVQGELHFFRRIPPPEQAGVPDPYGPPPAPGTPWGPMRCRVVVPLLTLVLAPRMRLLELVRSPRAYGRHLRKYLERRFRAESAHERRRDTYRFDGAGRVLRRVSVRTWHFRGAGAAAVLRVAAEQGWTLDHSFPADPRGTLHLCRLDGGRGRKP
ncbi:hypothetical protein [Kitasatospora sp. NPDC097691]|uniref:hypothetical protein n=1 Tax=Kitasatospora sp. NPDC097691 TaxID=3157231 RepID=UPI003327E050